MHEIPPLPETTILLVEVGSTAHGTGVPGGEDHDEMGVVIEPPEAVLGLDPGGFTTVMQRTQPEGTRSGPGDTDRTLHSLRRFLRLAAGGNPSILMSFWAPVLYATDEGHQLRALADAFIGRHVVPRYRGYMESQAMRLLGTRGGGHGRRGGGQREELIAEHGYDTNPIQGEPADWLRAVRRGDVPFSDWQERWHVLDAALERLGADENYPAGPDRIRIEQWGVDTHLMSWRSRVGRP